MRFLAGVLIGAAAAVTAMHVLRFRSAYMEATGQHRPVRRFDPYMLSVN